MVLVLFRDDGLRTVEFRTFPNHHTPPSQPSIALFCLFAEHLKCMEEICLDALRPDSATNTNHLDQICLHKCDFVRQLRIKRLIQWVRSIVLV